jgi:hypothetical protein
MRGKKLWKEERTHSFSGDVKENNKHMMHDLIPRTIL